MNVWLNGCGGPVVVDGFVTVIVWHVTLTRKACEPVQPFASVARIVKEYGPVVVGVPERTPPVVSVRPGGSVPDETAHVTAPVAPVCVKVTGP